MEQGGNPPITSDGVATKPVSRWRWWLHLILLGLFPIVYGGLGLLKRNQVGTLLPADVGGLIGASIHELALFFVIFATAWLSSRVNGTQLMLPWRNGWMTLVLGFAYSIAARMIIIAGAIMLLLPWILLSGAHPDRVKEFRPHTEHLVNAGALTHSPLYFILCLTLVSFVVAALREELWRAGMLAGIRELYPRLFATWGGKIAAVMLVALFFGMGHTSQGWAAVGMTTVLGLGLGLVMVWHRSIWEAAIAHGFFDAGTFAMLFLVAKYLPGRVPL